MSAYLIDVGEFNIIVLPDKKQYFILSGDEASVDVQNKFIQGEPIDYGKLSPLWFPYGADEAWKDFDGKAYRLGEDVSENELIDLYVLKKFNFGSLVAVRETEGGRVKVFKRDLVKARTASLGSI